MSGMVVAKELEHWRGGKNSPGRRDAVRKTLEIVLSDIVIRPEKVYHRAYLDAELQTIEVIVSELRQNALRDGEVLLATELRAAAQGTVARVEAWRRDLERRHPTDQPASSDASIDRLWREACGLADGQLAVLREYVGRLERWETGDIALPTGGAS